MRSNQTLKYFSSLIRNIPDLTGRERRVLLKRIKKMTHVAIGKKWNVTEGRIRQIERTALLKVKSKAHQMALFKR